MQPKPLEHIQKRFAHVSFSRKACGMGRGGTETPPNERFSVWEWGRGCFTLTSEHSKFCNTQFLLGKTSIFVFNVWTSDKWHRGRLVLFWSYMTSFLDKKRRLKHSYHPSVRPNFLEYLTHRSRFCQDSQVEEEHEWRRERNHATTQTF